MTTSIGSEIPSTLLGIIFDRIHQSTSQHLGIQFRLHSFFIPTPTRKKQVRGNLSALPPSITFDELEQKLWCNFPSDDSQWYPSLLSSFTQAVTKDSLELSLTYCLSWLPLHSTLYKDFKPQARESVYPLASNDPFLAYTVSSPWRFDVFIKAIKNFDPYDQRQWDLAECIVDFLVADIVAHVLEAAFDGTNLSPQAVHHLVHIALHCFKNLEPQWAANSSLWKELREKILQRWALSLGALSRFHDGLDPSLFLTIFGAAQMSTDDALSYFRGLSMLQIDISVDAGVKRTVDFMDSMLALIDSKKNKSTKLKAAQVHCLDSVLFSISWDESVLPILDKSKAIYRRALRWMSKSEELEASSMLLASTLLARGSPKFFLEEYDNFVVKKLFKNVWSKKRDLCLECIYRILQGKSSSYSSSSLSPLFPSSLNAIHSHLSLPNFSSSSSSSTTTTTSSSSSSTTTSTSQCPNPLMYDLNNPVAPPATINSRIQALVLCLFSKKSQLFKASESVTLPCLGIPLQIAASNLAYAREFMLPTLLSEVRSSNPGNLYLGIHLLRSIIDPSAQFIQNAPCMKYPELTTPISELSTILGTTSSKLLTMCEQEAGAKVCGTVSSDIDRTPPEFCPDIAAPFLEWCAADGASYSSRLLSDLPTAEQLLSDTSRFALLRWNRLALDATANPHEWNIQQQQSIRLLSASVIQIMVRWLDHSLSQNTQQFPGIELTLPLSEFFIPDLPVTPFDDANDETPGATNTSSSSALPLAIPHNGSLTPSFTGTFSSLDPNTIINHLMLPPFQSALSPLPTSPALAPLSASTSFSSASTIPQTPRSASNVPTQSTNLTLALLRKTFMLTSRTVNIMRTSMAQSKNLELQIMGFKEWVKCTSLKRNRSFPPDTRCFLELYKEIIHSFCFRLPDDLTAILDDPTRFFGQTLLHSDPSLASVCSKTIQNIFYHHPELRNPLLMAMVRLTLHPSHLQNPHHIYTIVSRFLALLDFWVVMKLSPQQGQPQPGSSSTLAPDTAMHVESLALIILCQPDPTLRVLALNVLDAVHALLPSRTTSSVALAMYLNLKDIQENVHHRYLRDAARGLPTDLALSISATSQMDPEGGASHIVGRQLELAALADVAGSHCQLLWTYYLSEIGRICVQNQVELDPLRQHLLHSLEVADPLPLEDSDDSRVYNHESRILRRNYTTLLFSVSGKLAVATAGASPVGGTNDCKESTLSLFRSSILPALFSDVAWTRDVVFLALGSVYPSSIPAFFSDILQWYQDLTPKRKPLVLRWVLRACRYLLQERQIPTCFFEPGNPFLNACLIVTDIVANTFGQPKPGMTAPLRPENIGLFIDAYLFLYYFAESLSLASHEIELLVCTTKGPIRRRLRPHPVCLSWTASQRRALVFTLISWSTALSASTTVVYRWSSEESTELAKIARSFSSHKRDAKVAEIDRSLRDLYLLAPYAVESIVRLGPLFDKEDLDKTDAFFRSVPTINWFVQVERLGPKVLRWLLAHHFPQLFYIFLDMAYQQSSEPDRNLLFLEAIFDQIIDGSASAAPTLNPLHMGTSRQGISFAPRLVRSGLTSELVKASKLFASRCEGVASFEQSTYQEIDDIFSLNLKDVAGAFLFVIFFRAIDTLLPLRQRCFELMTRLIPTGMGLDRELPISATSAQLFAQLFPFSETFAASLLPRAIKNCLVASSLAAITVPMFTEKMFAEGFQRFSRFVYRQEQLWVLEFLLPWCDNLQLGVPGEHNLLESSASDFLGAVYSQFTLILMKHDPIDMPHALRNLWLRLGSRGRQAQDPNPHPNLPFILKFLLAKCHESELDLAVCRHLFLAFYQASPTTTLGVLTRPLSFQGIVESLGKVNADPNLDIALGTVSDLQKKLDAQAEYDAELHRLTLVARQSHQMRQAIIAVLFDLVAADIVSMLPYLHIIFNWILLRLANVEEASLLRPLLQFIIDAILHQLPAASPETLSQMVDIQKTQYNLAAAALRALRQALSFSTFSLDWNYDRYLLEEASILSMTFLSEDSASYSLKRGSAILKKDVPSPANFRKTKFGGMHRSSSSSELSATDSSTSDTSGVNTRNLMKQLQTLTQLESWLRSCSVPDLVGILCAALMPFAPTFVDRWGEEALSWATEYQDLQLSLLAHQIFRSLLSPLNSNSIVRLFHCLLDSSHQLESAMEQLLVLAAPNPSTAAGTTPVDLLATLIALSRGKVREVLLTFLSVARATTSMFPLNVVFSSAITFLHLNHPVFAPLYFQAADLLDFLLGSQYIIQVPVGDLAIFTGKLSQIQNWNFSGLQPLLILGLQNELTYRKAVPLLVRCVQLSTDVHRGVISMSPAQIFTTTLAFSCWLDHIARISSFDSRHPAHLFALQGCHDMITALRDPRVSTSIPDALPLSEAISSYLQGSLVIFSESVCQCLAQLCIPKYAQDLADTLTWMFQHTPSMYSSIVSFTRQFVTALDASMIPAFANLIQKSVSVLSFENQHASRALFSSVIQATPMGSAVSVQVSAPPPPPISGTDLHLSTRGLESLQSLIPLQDGQDHLSYESYSKASGIRIIGSLSIALRSANSPPPRSSIGQSQPTSSTPKKSDFELLQMQLGGLTASTLSLPPSISASNIAELDAALSGLDKFVIEDDHPNKEEIYHLLIQPSPSDPLSTVHELLSHPQEPHEIEDLTSALDELEQYM